MDPATLTELEKNIVEISIGIIIGVVFLIAFIIYVSAGNGKR